MTGGLVRAWLGKCEYPCNLVWVLDKKSKDQQMLVLSVLYNFFDYVDMVVQGIQAYRYRRSHHRIGKEQDAGREKLYSIVLILKRWGKANSSLFWFDTNAPRCIDSLISSRLFYFLRIKIKPFLRIKIKKFLRSKINPQRVRQDFCQDMSNTTWTFRSTDATTLLKFGSYKLFETTSYPNPEFWEDASTIVLVGLVTFFSMFFAVKATRKLLA